MGTFAKYLGQMMRKSMESESSNILRTIRANKIENSLSKKLDTTLEKGHDMKVFGLGTIASMASVERYSRFTTAMFHVYSEMETQLDECVRVSREGEAVSASAKVWMEHGSVLRRAARLQADLADVSEPMPQIDRLRMTPAVANYVSSIQESGVRDREDHGGRLLGHLYCRYFADLFGGSVLKAPYNLALGLQQDTPRHYDFEFPADSPKRKEFINRVYSSINSAGEDLSSEACAAIVNEASRAFACNVAVYSEEPLWADSIRGTSKLAIGALIAAPRWLGGITASRHA